MTNRRGRRARHKRHKVRWKLRRRVYDWARRFHDIYPRFVAENDVVFKKDILGRYDYETAWIVPKEGVAR